MQGFDKEALLTLITWANQNKIAFPQTPEEAFALTSLVIKKNVLLPAELGALKNLKHFEIDTYLSFRSTALDWPVCLEELSSLETLILEGIPLRSASSNWGKLASLRTLKLNQLWLTSLHASIGRLQSLEVLDLFLPTKSETWELPEELGQLSSLRKLNVNASQLSKLPADWSQLTQLQEIKITADRLTSLPAGIASLSSLKEAGFYSKQDLQLPSAIEQWTSLEKLTLNNPAALPASIGSCKNLVELTIIRSSIQELPESFGKLTSLQKVSIAGSFCRLPDSIGDLQSLRKLSIEAQLTELPDSFSKLHRLAHVHLRSNQLKTIPALPSAVVLQLDHNAITTIDSDISHCTQLQRLHLAGNKITTIDAGIRHLSKLVKFDLSRNQLVDLPKELAELVSLKELNLARNQISELPLAVIRRRGKIQIDLFHNPILENEKNQAKELMTSCFRGDAKGAIAALHNGAGQEYAIGAMMKTSDDGMISGWGPPALFFACLVPDGEELVKEMLMFGGNPNQRWIYDGDWDPEDCYMSESEITVLQALQDLKSKGYSKHIEQWAQRQKLLNDLGWSVQDREIWRASVNPAALALLLQAAEG